MNIIANGYIFPSYESIIFYVIYPRDGFLGCFIYLFRSEINFTISIFMEISLSISLYSFLDWKSGSRIYFDIKCQNNIEPVLYSLNAHLILKKNI